MITDNRSALGEQVTSTRWIPHRKGHSTTETPLVALGASGERRCTHHVVRFLRACAMNDEIPF